MKMYPTPLALILDPAPTRARAGHDAFPALHFDDRTTHDNILHRAYAIWEQDGHPDNLQLSHWLRAEAEVRHT